jgi:hypothetical protein
MQYGLTISACFLSVLATNAASAEKKPRPPTLSDLATVWVGEESRGGLEYFRLELDRADAGVLAVQWLPGGRVDAYRVDTTRLDRDSLEFGLRPVDKEAEPIYLRGRVTHIRLSLEVGGKTHSWTRSVALERYDDLTARLSAVNQRAQEYWAAARR